MKQLRVLWSIWVPLFTVLVVYGLLPLSGVMKPNDGGRELPPVSRGQLVSRDTE